MAKTADKNMIDKDEYPQTAEIERRCVNIIGRLWHAPGTRDVDRLLDDRLERSRDAGRAGAQVALARADEQAGKPTDRPNLVTGVNVQVCWEKFCRYWDVEPRLVPMEGERFHLDAERPRRCVTRTRSESSRSSARRSTAAMSRSARSARRSTTSPPRADRTCRFTSTRPRVASSPRSCSRTSCGTSSLTRVQSINASGHKYGLVYPGRRLGDLARRGGAAAGSRVRRQLPRRLACRRSR